jgi:enoyl-CoA hydratase/carnithine racemase
MIDGNMNWKTIDFAIENGVAIITLDRPHRLNGFTVAMGRELVAAYDLADADDEVRSVVLTGRGRVFCAGADLDPSGTTFDFDPGPQRDPAAPSRDPGGVVTLRMYESTKPIIAAVNGSAVGVGLSMTLPADVRILAEGSKLGFVFAARGIAPDAASSWFLSRIVGMGRALEWCLSARLFDSTEALASGLVHDVVPAAEVLPRALAIATSMAESSAPVAATMTRQLLWRMAGATSPYEAHRLESLALSYLGRSDDATEGVRAFLEGRTPEWKLRVPRDLPDWFPWESDVTD